MDWSRHTSHKRPFDASVDAPQPTASAPLPKRRRARAHKTGLDRLTTLPQELLTGILQKACPTPRDNVLLQTVNRRVCATLRDNAFWAHVSPDAPCPNAPLTPLQTQIAQHALQYCRKPVDSREILYWQFQTRTAEGAGGYTPLQQKLLRYFWKENHVSSSLADPNSPYDLARATASTCTDLYPFRRYSDDASFMLARAPRGPEHMRTLSQRLRADIGFMHKAVAANLRNYSLATESLRLDEAFNSHVLEQCGRAFMLMPAQARSSKLLALLALQRWNVDVPESLETCKPYPALSKTIRQDPDVIYACAQRCATTLLSVVAAFPQSHWGQDRKLVTLALQPHHFAKSRSVRDSAYSIFSGVHDSLRDDEEISLLAVTPTSSNFACVSLRLRSDAAWCAKAVAANPDVAFCLDPEMARNEQLLAALSPKEMFSCLGAFSDTVGSDLGRLTQLLRDPSVRQARSFTRPLLIKASVYSQIHSTLRDNVAATREILDFDGREIRWMPAEVPQDFDRYAYAADAFLGQLCDETRNPSLRHGEPFVTRQSKPDGSSALGIFAADRKFARQLLVRYPECDHLFASDVRRHQSVISLARLGAFLQQESGVHKAKPIANISPMQMHADLRHRDDDFAINLAHGGFSMIRGRWDQAYSAFALALHRYPEHPTPRQVFVCQQLGRTLPERCPPRSLFWYRGIMALARDTHRRLVQQVPPAGQAPNFWEPDVPQNAPLGSGGHD